MGRQKILNQMD